VIDWHIRLLLGGAWLLFAIYVLKLHANARSPDALVSIFPAALVYFMYHPILEVAMRGRTPGKRIAGVRIVSRSGATPSTTALLIRNIFRLIDGLPGMYVIGLTTCFVTAHRVRVGDMAAGTLLVLDDTAAAKSLSRLETLAAGSALPLDTLELIDQIIERWPALRPDSRKQIACSLLERVQPGSAAQCEALSTEELHMRLLTLANRG
jgi:uncharacterized RDD family membrane protein YckC